MKIRVNRVLLLLAIFMIYAWDIFDELFPEGALLILLFLFGLHLVLNGFRISLGSRTAAGIFAFCILHALLCMMAGENNFLLFFKALTGILLTLLIYWNLTEPAGPKEAYALYYKVSFGFALFGILQEIAYWAGWKILYDKSFLFTDKLYEGVGGILPISCLFQEQAFMAMTMMPAVYIAVSIITKSTKDLCRPYTYTSAWVILCCSILTLSSTVYIGILVSVLLANLNNKKLLRKIALVLIAVAVCFFCYHYYELFRERADDLLFLIRGKGVKGTDKNISSYTLYYNIRVSIGNLLRTNFVGSGLGSYQLIYERMSGLLSLKANRLNMADGNSMWNRITAEMGISGILFIIWFLITNIRKKKDFLKVINWSCLVCILMKLLRDGHYFHLGFMFFIVIFIKTSDKRTEKF